MILPRLLLASGLSKSCVGVTLSRLDALGEAATNAGAYVDDVLFGARVFELLQ